MFGPTSGDDQRGRPFLPRQRHVRQARSLIAYRLVCMYVCLSRQTSNCFFFFVYRWNRAIFCTSVLHVTLYKTLFLDFWFRSHNAQNLLPKIYNCTKSHNSACMTDSLDVFAPTRGFSGMADSMLWGRPLLPRQRNLGKFGLFSTKSPISRLVCQIDRICLGLPGETTREADLCCHGNDICARRGV